jgi:hypothetical protein
MSGSDSRWGELSSQHERFVEAGEATRARPPATTAGPTTASLTIASPTTGNTARSEWAELASQSERLLDETDPLFRLASSSHTKPGMRLVRRTAA